jgi:putative phage-type endonuclease
MKQHTFLQGSPEWHAHRATSRNASDAPAMLGCSPYQTRQQLLHALHTGIRPEVDAGLQRRFDDGHAIEAAQRPGAEDVVGDELFPVVGSEEVEGVLLSASFDGLTMDESTVYECKTLNADLRAAFDDMETIAPDKRECGSGRCLPKVYRVQMEQQLAVSGAQRVLFVAATKDGSDVRRCWYYPDARLRAEIIAGWKQLEVDLANYTPAAAVEKIVAEPVEALPAPVVQVSGQLTLTDNFKVFEQRLRHFLEERLIREPKTDQDFADLDGQIKAMKQAREALKAAEAQMLAQVQPVDQAKKTKDMLDDLLQKNVSMAERLLKDEKERRRGEIVAGAVGALKTHIDGLNKRLGKPYMPATASAADFGGCIKGLKSLASMEDKVGTELARAKIAANEVADRIEINKRAIEDHAEFAHLFPDVPVLVLKAPDDCDAVIESRIAAHRAQEERRLEAERARIRQEEEARAAAKVRHEQEAAARAEQQRQREEAAQIERQRAADMAEKERLTREEPPLLQQANVVPMPTKAPTSAPTLRLGQINERIAPVSVDAAGLASLGFPHAASDKSAKLYHEADFPRICAALVQHLHTVARQQRAA